MGCTTLPSSGALVNTETDCCGVFLWFLLEMNNRKSYSCGLPDIPGAIISPPHDYCSQAALNLPITATLMFSLSHPAIKNTHTQTQKPWWMIFLLLVERILKWRCAMSKLNKRLVEPKHCAKIPYAHQDGSKMLFVFHTVRVANATWRSAEKTWLLYTQPESESSVGWPGEFDLDKILWFQCFAHKSSFFVAWIFCAGIFLVFFPFLSVCYPESYLII